MMNSSVVTLTIFTCVLAVAAPANARMVIGDTMNVANTFEDATFTGGAEGLVEYSSVTVVDPGEEFSDLATIYNVDVFGDSMTMTFNGNPGLLVNQYGPGTFDRYYIGFNKHLVDSISIAGGDAVLTSGLSVGLFGPGFQLDTPLDFRTDQNPPLPISFENGGFFIQFGEGTDYRDTSIGSSVTFNFSTIAVPEPSSLALFSGFVGLGLLRRSREGVGKRMQA